MDRINNINVQLASISYISQLSRIYSKKKNKPTAHLSYLQKSATSSIQLTLHTDSSTSKKKKKKKSKLQKILTVHAYSAGPQVDVEVNKLAVLFDEILQCGLLKVVLCLFFKLQAEKLSFD